MVNINKYEIGEAALECDIEAPQTTEADIKKTIRSLQVGDGAFVRRSDGAWRYAVVSELPCDASRFVTFIVAADGSTKRVSQKNWGDRVRRLKHIPDIPGSKVRNFLDKKDLRTSCDTQTTSPFDSHSSAELQHAAHQAGRWQGPHADDKFTDDRSGNSDDSNVVFREALPKHKLKEGLLTKERIQGMPVDVTANRLKRENTRASDNIKVQESVPFASNKKENKSTNHDGRKPSSLRRKGASALTTSLLFKNLMKVGGTPQNEEPLTSHLDKEGGIRSTGVHNSMPRSSVECGKSPPSTRSKPGFQRTAKSKRRGLSASAVLKNAFAHLMEEKMHPQRM